MTSVTFSFRVAYWNIVKTVASPKDPTAGGVHLNRLNVESD
jgi:hypothetical protein